MDVVVCLADKFVHVIRCPLKSGSRLCYVFRFRHPSLQQSYCASPPSASTPSSDARSIFILICVHAFFLDLYDLRVLAYRKEELELHFQGLGQPGGRLFVFQVPPSFLRRSPPTKR